MKSSFTFIPKYMCNPTNLNAQINRKIKIKVNTAVYVKGTLGVLLFKMNLQKAKAIQFTL